MFVVVVSPNKDGKVELSKEELQKMLDNAYDKGHSEGSKDNHYTITNPYTITAPSYPIYYSTNTTPRNNVEITC